MHSRLALVFAASVLAIACSHSHLPRRVAESAHRDYPDCRGHDIDGHALDVTADTWAVDVCGTQVTYQCPTGPHSRWRSCERIPTTSGGAVVTP